MPFLRRRGVMASENDMRRHTTLIDPESVKQPLRKPQAEAFLSPGAPSDADQGEADVLYHAPEGSQSSTNTMAAPATPTPARESEDPFDRPESPPIQEQTPKHRRFSMLRFRNASDSQLSTRLKQHQQAEKPPPMPQLQYSTRLLVALQFGWINSPAIITTAPTMDTTTSSKKQSRLKIPSRMRRSSDLPRSELEPAPRLRISSGGKKEKRKTMIPRTSSSASKQIVTFEEPERPSTSATTPTITEDHGPTLAPPVNRLSESSRSESSSVERPVPTPPPPGRTSSSFFRMPRRKQKQPEPLFPMAHLPQKAKTPGLSTTTSNTSSLPRDSTSTGHACDPERPSTGRDRATPLASPTHGLGSLGKLSGSPATALFRPSSRHSGQSSPTRAHLSLRGRSSTMSSLGEGAVDYQQSGTARTSSSTGRKSFGDLLGLSRMRQNPDPNRQGSLTPATPGSNTSKNNSLQLTREPVPVVLPGRREDDTPAKYLIRVDNALSRSVIASALSKGSDSFMAAVLRSHMRSLSFFEEPMDMSIRRLLMVAQLPKETQQIDRCLQAFANRYHECNPGIYASSDQAYFIAFSLLILHTDVFNKNNKYKMQKPDYLKNTRGEGICDDILECFYDNISYTPFIHVEDDVQVKGEPTGSLKSKKKPVFPNGTPEPLRRSKDPIDPYTLLIDGRLDTLRPPLRDQIQLEEHYNYLGTANRFNLKELQKTFFKTGVLQIVSARSRPDAFMTEKTQNNPQEAHPGIVDIKVTKVGTLWRKDTKRKKTRSPWQEWGAILTGAQLYFFRNTAWIKNLMQQYEAHIKTGHDDVPLIFNPPLENFKPDALMSTDGAVALYDTTYKKHKNAFVYVRHGGLEEVLLAQNEEDRNDWLAKLNYAAAFRTSGVRMRGVIGGNHEGQSRRAIRRLDSTDATQLIQTPTGEVTVNRSQIDHQMARDILVARREFMQQKIEEAEEKLQAAQKHLDHQLRNARHLLVLAPIQDKTREQVRSGAAKIIAQLKWSRIELGRLKCHRDVLALDLAEEKEVNGDLSEGPATPSTVAGKSLLHKGSRGSSHVTQQQSPRSPAPLSLSRSSEPTQQVGRDSPETDVFQTPPTSAGLPAIRDMPPLSFENADFRKASVSSAASSSKPVATSTPPPRLPSSPPSGQARNSADEQAAADARERQVLEQAGLLDMERVRTTDHRPRSSGKNADETPERSKRSSAAGAEKDRLERSRIRRSLQRTLRDGKGHMSHHRSRKGKDSASSGGMSDETVRDEVLSRGAGSFTVHGKKASVVNFGHELHAMSTEERIKHHRKHGQSGDEPGPTSPVSIDDDFQSVLSKPLEGFDRRGSGASASTATARSFRELHRKYSSSRAHKAPALGSLTVPSDEDSDAALSFSDGRRSPLPPLDDEEEDPIPFQAHFYTPDPPSSPVQQGTPAAGEGASGDTTHELERLPSPVIQEVRA
ncbi:Uu.00g091690.m01.CDS01 [Anthostomella pinea]|uniref:Uu.00g091690.m01.CDS01 n=1 Tax=Anthostomella pinea TaxID=933095 RepID=A0AAI8YKI7_9PEZI|nr:Uu.00g091690.m01.CDS01 [Anthostomella pinea]